MWADQPALWSADSRDVWLAHPWWPVGEMLRRPAAPQSPPGRCCRFRRYLRYAAAAAVFCASATWNQSVEISAQVISRVSVATDGTQANGNSANGSISADGRVIAFESDAANLSANCTTGTNVFVHNRVTRTTVCVSVAPDGSEANGSSFLPKLSADGRFVAFDSTATNLAAGCTSQVHVFVRDRLVGTTNCVSVASDGTPGNGDSQSLAISPDGRFVVFRSSASNLANSCTSGGTFRHDRLTRTTTCLSTNSSPAEISADGRFIVSSLRFPGTQVFSQVDVLDTHAGVTTRENLAHDNNPTLPSVFTVTRLGNGLSADGRFLVFQSSGGLGPPCHSFFAPFSNPMQVYVRDRIAQQTACVSVASDGSPANGRSHPVAISADGRFVSFYSSATNLAKDSVPGRTDVYVHDRLTGSTTRIDVGVEANGEILFDPLRRVFGGNADGRFVVFHSGATNLVPGDTNEATDVFVTRLALGPNWLIVAPSAAPTPAVIGQGQEGNVAAVEALVRGFDATAQPTLLATPPYPGFGGGIRIALGDVNGDGSADLITTPGPGGGPRVRVFEGSTAGRVLLDFFAYDPTFTGGVFVAAGDVDGDGRAEVITAAGQGGGPHVRVWKFVRADLPPVAVGDFFAYHPSFTGGVTVAAGVVDGSARASIVTGAGPGGGPHVTVWRLVGGTFLPFTSFFAYDPAFLGGVNVAVGDITGSGRAQVITGAGPGGGPHVRSFRFEADGTPVGQANFLAYIPGFAGGVNVAVGDVTGDGQGKIITGPGPGGPPEVRVIRRRKPPTPAPPPPAEIEVEPVLELVVGPPSETGGVNVGGDPPGGGAGDAL